jgi:hypothetical protein
MPRQKCRGFFLVQYKVPTELQDNITFGAPFVSRRPDRTDMKHISLALFLLLPSLASAQSISPAWIHTLHDTCIQSMSLGIQTDPIGNNYALAYFLDTTNQSYPHSSYNLLVKRDANGQLLWSDTFHLTPAGLHCKMVLGSDGCMYLGTRHPTAPYTGQFLVMRISPGGNVLWRNHFTAPAQVYEVNSMFCDDSMNIYLAGNSINVQDAIMMKCDSSGNLKWTAGYSDTQLDRGNAITADRLGNAYVGIASMDSSSHYIMVLVKYSSTGQLLWERHFAGFPNQQPQFVQVYNDTSIVICGHRYDTVSQVNILTVQYDSSGTLKWWQEFDADSYFNLPYARLDMPVDMMITSSGKTAIAARWGIGTSQWMNLLYDRNGTLLWAKKEYDLCYANSVSEDNAGNLIFSAHASDTATNISGVGFCKYDTLGNLLWRTIHPITGSFAPLWPAMDTDGMGSIYWAGINGGATEDSLFTLKFDYTTTVAAQSEISPALVFPIPADEEINFNFSGDPQNRMIAIYDVHGRQVKSVSSTENHVNIPVADLEAGMYFYQVMQNGIPSSGKLIVK